MIKKIKIISWEATFIASEATWFLLFEIFRDFAEEMNPQMTPAELHVWLRGDNISFQSASQAYENKKILFKFKLIKITLQLLIINCIV